MCSALFEGVRTADINDFYLKLHNVQIWTVLNCKLVYLPIARNGICRSRNVQIIAVPSSKMVDLLMFTNSGFKERNVEICANVSSNEVDLLILRNRVFRQRNVQKCPVQSCKDFDFMISGTEFWGFEFFTYWKIHPAMWSICWFSGIEFSGCEMFK